MPLVLGSTPFTGAAIAVTVVPERTVFEVAGYAENAPNEPHQIQFLGLSTDVATVLSTATFGELTSCLMSFSSGYTVALNFFTHAPVSARKPAGAPPAL